MQNILIVDDEATVREIAQRYLEREGFGVLCAASGTDALRLIEDDGARIALVILDIMLPGINGLEVLKRVRARGATPVILLSARTDESDRVLGLEFGADDYVPKPFGPRELVSRVKAVLRRAQPAPVQDSQALTLGRIALRPDTREVTLDGIPVELTAKEFDLLWFFMRHPRQVFSREQLLDNVWGFSEYIDASTVTVHIHRLRDKVEVDPAKPKCLVTVWGVGYRLTGD